MTSLSYSIPVPRDRQHDQSLARVAVDLLNDAGDARVCRSWGDSADEAVQRAIAYVSEVTGDDTYVMTDWTAA